MISRRFKLCTVLIIATILLLIIPVVTAENIQNASAAKAASALPLPQLRFNETQEKIIVSGELSPGKSVQITQNMQKFTIPTGAIIHHANSITTVFDQNGNQIFMADDNQAETIHTFRGDSPATFIHEVPNNSVIIDNGNTLQVINNNARILTIIKVNSKESLIPAPGDNCFGNPFPDSYVEGAEAAISSTTGVSQFTARWNIPTTPLDTTGLVTKPYFPVYTWNALYYCTNGDVRTSFIQPVLTWNLPTNNSWNMQMWYIWTNTTTQSNSQKYPYGSDDLVGTLVSNSQISSGDTIQGNIQINPEGNDAIGSITDLGPTGGGSSQLTLKHNQDPEWNTSRPVYAQIVLEGGGYNNDVHGSRVLTQNSARNYTGPITFKNFTLTDKNGASILSSTTMTSFINS